MKFVIRRNLGETKGMESDFLNVENLKKRDNIFDKN